MSFTYRGTLSSPYHWWRCLSSILGPQAGSQTHWNSVALPMEGPVSPESYPTGTENGKARRNSQGNHETLMNRQLSSCLRSLSGGHHHWVRCSWLPDNAVMMMPMTKRLLEFAKGCNLSLGCQFARINLLNIDFANFLIPLIFCVSMSPEPPLKEHPLRQVRRKQDMLTWGLECAAIFRKFNRSISGAFPLHPKTCVIYLAGAYEFVPSFLIYELLFIIFNFSELYSSCSMRYIIYLLLHFFNFAYRQCNDECCECFNCKIDCP